MINGNIGKSITIRYIGDSLVLLSFLIAVAAIVFLGETMGIILNSLLFGMLVVGVKLAAPSRTQGTHTIISLVLLTPLVLFFLVPYGLIMLLSGANPILIILIPSLIIIIVLACLWWTAKSRIHAIEKGTNFISAITMSLLVLPLLFFGIWYFLH
jgi:hypothetical protein